MKLEKNFEDLENNFVPVRELQANLPEIQQAKRENQKLYENIINAPSNYMLKKFKIEELWQHIELVIEELYNNSVIFYGIRIKKDAEWYEEAWKQEKTKYQFYNKEFNIFKKKIKADKKEVDVGVKEEEVNDDTIFNEVEKKEIRIYKAWYDTYGYVEFIKNRLLDVELTEFVYCVIEEIGVSKPEVEYEVREGEGEKGFPELHIIFGKKNLIGEKEKLLINLKENFSPCYRLDLNIKEWKALETKKEIKQYWYELIKKIRTENNKILLQNHFYYSYTANSRNVYCTLEEYLETGSLKEIYGGCTTLDHKHSELNLLYTSPHLNLKSHPELQLLNLWNVYCQMENIIYYENQVYEKNKKSKYTYERVGRVEYFRNNQDLISCKLSKEFYFQVNNKIVKEIYSEGYEKAEQKIKQQPYLLPNRIKVYEHLVEYEDGIYNLKEERYLEYEKIEKYLWKDDINEGLRMWIGCSKYINNKLEKNEKIKKMDIIIDYKNPLYLFKDELFMEILEFLSLEKQEQEKIKFINEALYVFN